MINEGKQNSCNDNELGESIMKGLKQAIEKLKQGFDTAVMSLQEFEKQREVVREKAKEIEELEHRKKHCKNYLELKQINRKLNVLKYRQGRKWRA